MSPLRITHARVRVLTALLDAPGAVHYGYDILRKTGLRTGVVYPVLARLLEEGWLSDDWEDARLASREHRPPRRFYRLTPLGRFEATAAVAEYTRRAAS